MAKYLLLIKVILPDFSTYSWSSLLGEGQLDPDKESSKTKLELMDAILKKADTLFIAKNNKLLVVIQFSIIDMTKENVVLDYEYLQNFPKYNRTNLTNALESICVRNRIHFVNLIDLFMRNNPDSLYFIVDDNHWNDKGQDIAAKETASYISNILMTE